MKLLVSPYKSYGIYRFLDECKNTIYIGKSNNINRRISREHFKGESHLTKRDKDFRKVARVDIIKLEDNADTSGLEIYLIDKYKPVWNDKDKSKSLSMNKYRDKNYYEQLENWKPYLFIKEFDQDKIKFNKIQSYIAVGFVYAIFIAIVVVSLMK